MAHDGGGHWLVSRPAPFLETPRAGGLVLRRPAPSDVDALVVAITESLDHLSPWMAWARRPVTRPEMRSFVARAEREWRAGREFQYLIWASDGGTIVGGCGLHARNGRGVLEIGYWVHVGHLRRGIATAAAGALGDAAFALPEVRRVEISYEAANTASGAVPAKLGYRPVGQVPATRGGHGTSALVWALARGEGIGPSRRSGR